MSLVPELDKQLITKGWQRVPTGFPVKRYYQWYSFKSRKWIQCRKDSPGIVKYESLYRYPVSIWAWIHVGWRIIFG